MRLYGEILKEPKLRFNYSSDFAQETYHKKGLRSYGPYDANLFGKNKLKCIVLFPDSAKTEKTVLMDGLGKGEGTFRGFKDLFKVPVEFAEEIALTKNVDLLVDKIPSKDPDIVYLLLTKKDSNLYKQVKVKLLANGIPSQMVTIEKLGNPNGRKRKV